MRRYSWPDGHWNWPVNLTHKHGVRAGNLIFTGGQVDLDQHGEVRNPDNLCSQCLEAMVYLASILKDLDSDIADLVRLVVYYTGDLDDEKELLGCLADVLGGKVRPAINLICMPELCYPGMRVEIEGVAMRTPDGQYLERKELHLADMPELPEAFSHVVCCEGMVFTSDISAISPKGSVSCIEDISGQTELMMKQLGRALASASCDFGDVVKLNLYYLGDGTAENWAGPAKIRAGYFPDPGPAATGMPLPGFAHPDVLTKISVTAIRGENGQAITKKFGWPEGHWNWTDPMPYKHGNKCANVIHVGGQVSLDTSGEVVDMDQMVAQTRTAMKNLSNVLAELGATLDDVVKVTTFYQGNASADALHENLLIRSNSYTEPGPATTGIPIPNLVYEGMVIEIEAIAVVE